jgi:hypothetical protein
MQIDFHAAHGPLGWPVGCAGSRPGSTKPMWTGISLRAGPRGRRSVRNAEQLESSQALHWLVRAGFAARVLTYAVMGGLAAALALGAGTDGVAPNQQGALALIDRSASGEVALVLVAAGLLSYAIWKFTQAILGRGPEGGGSPKTWDRFSNAAGGVAYVAFFMVAVQALAGSSGGDSSSQTKHAAAGVLGWPGGPVLVAVAGGVLLAISAYQIYEALSGHFAREVKTAHMGHAERRMFMWLGKVGITARAMAFGLVGYFVVITAVTYDPRQAVGVDGALARLHHQTLGPELVGLAGLGFMVFAAYSVLEGRYRRL